uniref:DUF2442 domain-containing protein n=1 Tax=Candidatus Kentrum sp. UNK TaxID=2126344 RepID=A0A450ZWE1_9GAMM|nr:MAG: Protein of unknown function (DUF2442) [Candidatus Kentron sp. UNK]VFK68245.1 MAG: Protein of unknown function (DUF2442) [Candidatus Kentron sp. UNK]
MIHAEQIIAIEEAKYIGDYKLALLFNDHTERVVDFYPFLSSSLNPLISEYLNMGKFLEFEIDGGDLEWNDYDLCFPVADLYENRIGF